VLGTIFGADMYAIVTGIAMLALSQGFISLAWCERDPVTWPG
jgi:hypothetical protein